MVTAVVSGDQVSIRNLKRLAGAGLVLAAIGVMCAQPALAGKTVEAFIPVQTSTVATNGDVNPYGVAFVPKGFPKGGKTASGDILVSNFNAAPPLGQGTGTTIVSVTPDGVQTTFFQGTTPLGLTTALNALQNGFVIVGNAVPNAAKATSPVVKGTVVFNDSTRLHGPLGLVLAPNGDLISSQGDAVNPDPNQQSEIVEFTKSGKFVTEFAVDSTVGAAFGIALDEPKGPAVNFAAVNDTLNTAIVYDLSDK